jgi:hypothetical protein
MDTQETIISENIIIENEPISKHFESDCQELKNIKYKTMLLNGALLHETKSASDITNLDKFLENEKTNNSNEPWCKLNKTVKTKKFAHFVELYKKTNSLDDEETKLLLAFLKESLDRKKLQRVKDVVYDKNSGEIKEIPALVYSRPTKHFTLKNIDKRVSTLKSLAPKKQTGTHKSKGEISLHTDPSNTN